MNASQEDDQLQEMNIEEPAQEPVAQVNDMASASQDGDAAQADDQVTDEEEFQ